MIADLKFTNFSAIRGLKLEGIKAMAMLDLLRIIYFAAFGTLYWAINNINNYQKKADAAEIKSLKNARETADLEIKLARSQNAYLQQQINPHLLFNSLNFIHSSVYKLSREAAENIILLSDIMRYSLEETDADGKINLEKEAEQIENLIYPLDISYLTEGGLAEHKIIPLVLMTLTENLFKHGDLSKKQAIIKLTVKDHGELKFYTFNHKRPQPPVERIKSIGIENIKIRLNYAYGPDYKLAVNQTDEIYESELTLQL
ncbi:histidine kinase [Mucilaginibacter sp. BJC16-A38]|uniref:sensor histidine kinase n=1 Tax=Mucilaginibacter phenanthrenivorans TaxID=1234842 RepID=UPI0021588ACC|nr:histidine kinase [Mucilaginibacter phenanthrenivorans]MCR8560431.1 histidine kinase [Mucilaginibacter phenanthrenivorans]